MSPRAPWCAPPYGSLANVRINLDSITDEGFHRDLEERVAGLA
jgi:formiminotetrahydrofolate cyclodeaminase